MKVRVVKIFGHEVLRIESHYEATVSDVVQAIIKQRADNDEVEYVYECSCGTDDDDDDEESEIDGRFADMTERIVWDARNQEFPFPFPLFEPKPEEDDE